MDRVSQEDRYFHPEGVRLPCIGIARGSDFYKMSAVKTIKIIIADDHALVRSGIVRIVETDPRISVEGEAATGPEVMNLARKLDVDVVLLDLSMPGISGTDLIRRLHADRPRTSILVLSMHNVAQMASRAIRAGASGYLTKDSDPDLLLAAIHKVAAGGNFIDPHLAAAMIFGNGTPEIAPHDCLSDRELQILRELAAGKSVNHIAEAYSLSAKTISTHKMRLMKKLGIDNNAEIVRYALDHGLLQ